MHLFDKKLILLDLDGTLVDSAPDLVWCIQKTLRVLGLADIDPMRLQKFVGNGAAILLKRSLTDRMDGVPDEALFKQAMALFLDIYANNLCQYGSLYPGVTETLDILSKAGKRLACVTNKPGRFTAPLLELLDINRYFDLVLSGDTLAKMKPDPLPLNHAVSWFNVSSADTVMIGDSSNDIIAARAADIVSIAVSYGYNHGEDIRHFGADKVIDRFDELISLFAS